MTLPTLDPSPANPPPTLADHVAPIDQWRPAIDGLIENLSARIRAMEGAQTESERLHATRSIARLRMLGDCMTWGALRAGLIVFYDQSVSRLETSRPASFQDRQAAIEAFNGLAARIDVIRAYQALLNLVDFIMQIDEDGKGAT